MPDPFGSMQGFFNQFMGFLRSPGQSMIQKRLGLSSNWMQNPGGEVQRLMNEKRMTQEQYNQLNQVAHQIMATPQWQQMMGGQNGQQNGQGNSSSTR